MGATVVGLELGGTVGDSDGAKVGSAGVADGDLVSPAFVGGNVVVVGDGVVGAAVGATTGAYVVASSFVKRTTSLDPARRSPGSSSHVDTR